MKTGRLPPIDTFPTRNGFVLAMNIYTKQERRAFQWKVERVVLNALAWAALIGLGTI